MADGLPLIRRWPFLQSPSRPDFAQRLGLGCQSLTDAAVVALAERCTGIASVYFGRCNLTGEGEAVVARLNGWLD